MEEKELLEEILKETKKRNIWAMISGLCLVGIFLVVFIGMLQIVPEVKVVMKNADATISTAQESFENLKKATKDMTDFYDDNAKTMTEAMENIRDIDYDSLNKAIKDLQNSIEPFSNFVSLFKK